MTREGKPKRRLFHWLTLLAACWYGFIGVVFRLASALNTVRAEGGDARFHAVLAAGTLAAALLGIVGFWQVWRKPALLFGGLILSQLAVNGLAGFVGDRDFSPWKFAIGMVFGVGMIMAAIYEQLTGLPERTPPEPGVVASGAYGVWTCPSCRKLNEKENDLCWQCRQPRKT